MTEDRAARGRRALGYRRLRAHLAATLALVLAGVSASLASGLGGVALPGLSSAEASGGGAGIPTTPPTPTTPTSTPAPTGRGPFTGRGMWIWEMPGTEGGSVAKIVARAKRYHVDTLMIKSGDGGSLWSQFNPRLVATLHANGFRVCAWQYVYGSQPGAEAQVGVASVKAGADCLLIDAESDYEGKYVQAQRYVTLLRKQIGANFPVALAGFPYVDFHPAFPYSVFLGPGGAQFNVPQMYWFDIGTTVDGVYSHTFEYNRVYGRAIYPLGQVYNNPPPRQVLRFRQLSAAYGAGGVSWWDWQEAPPAQWNAISQPPGPLTRFKPDTTFASLASGDQGDLVVWAQLHLVSAGRKISVDGSFSSAMQRVVKRFQTANGLAPTGVIDQLTWQSLLRYAPASVRWTLRKGQPTATTSAAGGRVLTPVPKSASLPAIRNEIPGAGGAGVPRRR